jgi:hypothetical protein
MGMEVGEVPGRYKEQLHWELTFWMVLANQKTFT